MAVEKKDVIRETDAPSILMAKSLIRTARYGALAAIDPEDAWPLASRVGVATVVDGTPIILVSGLSSHTRAIVKDPRCSLLVGEPSKGDPLAYPRITLVCRATRIERETTAQEQAKERYLARHPKAQLYVGLGDFSFFRLDILRASMNGGFGKAYLLTSGDLRCAGDTDAFASQQAALSAQLNRLMGTRESNGENAWRIVGLDPEGVDMMDGDRAKRVAFHATQGPTSAKQAFEKSLVKAG